MLFTVWPSPAGLGNDVGDSLQGYNADISHNVSKRLARPPLPPAPSQLLWELRTPKKTPVPAAASELPSEFGLGTAEEDIGSPELVASCEDQRLFRLRTTRTMRKPGISLIEPGG